MALTVRYAASPQAVTSDQDVEVLADSRGRIQTVLYDANGNPVATNASGAIQTVPGSSTLATYSAGIVGLAPAALATDVFTIVGSASKTVKIVRLTVSGIATAAGAYAVQLLKRSAADTGGTATQPTVVPHDSTDAAGTAVVNAYTANPAGLGTLTGVVRVRRITVTTAAGAIPNIVNVFEFAEGDLDKPVTLRGVAQLLAVSLNGVTMTGGALDLDVTWTEE